MHGKCLNCLGTGKYDKWLDGDTEPCVYCNGSGKREKVSTPFKTKCEILADLWLNYRDDVDFDDYIQYCDLGLPLAYAIANDIIEVSDGATNYVQESFDLLLDALDIEEDYGFEDLDEIMSTSVDE